MRLNIIGPTFTKYYTITFDVHKMRRSNSEEKMQSCPKQLTTILDVEDDESISLLTATPNETSRTPPAQGLKSITIQTQLQHDSPSLIAFSYLVLARVLQPVPERNKT